MNLNKLKFPIIRNIFPNMIVQNITDIQPMSTLPQRKRKWRITKHDGKWYLTRWWSGIFIIGDDIADDTTQFDTKQEAINAMILEQLEQ